jgi:hypothetical protein
MMVLACRLKPSRFHGAVGNTHEIGVLRRSAMTRRRCLSLLFLALFVVSIASIAAAQTAKPFSTAPALEAAKASPELVSALSKEIGGTPEQAAGAAGALFGVAKSRLAPNQFSQVASAVPGMDLLLKAAPAASDVAGTSGALSQLGGSASGLAAAATAFSKMGLSPNLVAKAVPVLTSFVTKSGGAGVGSLLAGVLK